MPKESQVRLFKNIFLDVFPFFLLGVCDQIIQL